MTTLYNVHLKDILPNEDAFQSKSGQAMSEFCTGFNDCSVMHIGKDGIARVYLTQDAAAKLHTANFVERVPIAGDHKAIYKTQNDHTFKENDLSVGLTR